MVGGTLSSKSNNLIAHLIESCIENKPGNALRYGGLPERG